MSIVLIGLSALCFGALALLAWAGTLGFKGLVLIALSFLFYGLGYRGLTPAQRRPVGSVAKVAFTMVGLMALLRHPIEAEGQMLPLYEALQVYISAVDPKVFVFWGLMAMAIKFVGVLGSAFAWWMLLRGQGIRFPFWQSIVSAFLIGRFIGTFLPSTLGLDAYTLYESVRYSNQGSRAVTAKALEKFIGATGLFLNMVLTLPFGYQVIVDVTSKADSPEAALPLAAAILAVAGGISAVVVTGLVWPFFLVRGMQLVEGIVRLIPKIGPRLVGTVETFTAAVGAYEGKVGLLMMALMGKFVTHFTTAVVYFCTALAIGVVGAQFWPIVFGSSIQILATLLSPTIAGEGTREAFQALLLSRQLDGVAPAVLSGALGFIAAEAATLWGGVFLWTRTDRWRPTFVEVDGERVDFAWITDGGGFDLETVSRMRRGEE